MTTVIIVLALLLIIVSWAWVKGLSNMKENHPDYKGEDWLNWDDNKNHTESNF